MVPRMVLVDRPTEYSELLARHGTREQVHFFLDSRERSLADVEERHRIFGEHRTRVLGAVPSDWRQTEVTRADLDRFLFEPEDIVVVLGQDGLVPNVAKYLDGQPVIGLNPEPARFPGVLVRHAPEAAADLMRDVARGRGRYELRTMASATLDDGQQLDALNEIFVGHRSHQSARYVLSVGRYTERQSSSGLIVATGTGMTGWAKSIRRERGKLPEDVPAPEDNELLLLVREAWESEATHADLTADWIKPPAVASVTCELGEGGVVFADGIETDRLDLDWGQTVRVGVAERRLMLAI